MPKRFKTGQDGLKLNKTHQQEPKRAKTHQNGTERSKTRKNAPPTRHLPPTENTPEYNTKKNRCASLALTSYLIPPSYCHRASETRGNGCPDLAVSERPVALGRAGCGRRLSSVRGSLTTGTNYVEVNNRTQMLASWFKIHPILYL